ncbi:MAG: 50S ribosomal protein L10 [bacterium]|nr:50S ribosomal protein L10 [bacterium]
MAKSKDQKKDTVANLEGGLKNNKLTVVATFEGVSVADSDTLRNNLFEKGSSMLVAKKTLLRRALENVKFSGLDLDPVRGIVGVVSSHDEVGAAKSVQEFSKGKEGVALIGGWLEGQYLEVERVKALADLPSKEQLIATTVYTIKAPLTGFVNVLSGNLRGLITVLKAVGEKGQGG